MSLDDPYPDDRREPGLIHQHPLAYLIGLEGVGLMKAFAGQYDQAFTERRLAEIRRLLEVGAEWSGSDLEPMSTVAAYDGWASTYDSPDNALFALEEPIVWPLLDRLPIGVAVDAACGTGRHAAHLAGLGHRVHGFDTSELMLGVATQKVPEADFQVADIRALPMTENSVDLIVIALALAHMEDLAPVFGEAARLLRPGGHLVISDTRGHYIGSRLYPLVKWDVDGNVGYLPTWRHSTSEYLNVALQSGFIARGCQEVMRDADVVDADTPQPALDVTPEMPPDIWELHDWAPEGANAAFEHNPSLIVWDFELEPAPSSLQ